MNRLTRAALLGGLLLPLALAFAAPPAAAEANPQVEAELTRLIAGYAASGQEQFDRLTVEQQQELAACLADTLGELPADDMSLLTTGDDLEQVMDTIGPRFEERAGAEAVGTLRGCFDTASAQIDAAEAPPAAEVPAMTAAPTATGIDGELLAAMEKVLRDSEPPAESAVLEMMACMQGTLMPVMTEDEKRKTIDTSFSEEVGQALAQAHQPEFDAFMACGEEVAARYE